jgi:hypothetical protein
MKIHEITIAIILGWLLCAISVALTALFFVLYGPEMASTTIIQNELGQVEVGRKGPILSDSVELRYGQDRMWRPPKDYRED